MSNHGTLLEASDYMLGVDMNWYRATMFQTNPGAPHAFKMVLQHRWGERSWEEYWWLNDLDNIEEITHGLSILMVRIFDHRYETNHAALIDV